MKIRTKYAPHIRDLDRLIKHPVKGMTVVLVEANGANGTRTYDVACKNLLDLAHEVKGLSTSTAETLLG